MFAIDFGTGAALKIWGPDGEVSRKSLSLPRVAGGRLPYMEFTMPLEALLQKSDVVVESPTIGSSGAEVAVISDIVSRAPHKLYTISARAVKNYRADNNIGWRKGARYVRDGSPPPVMIELSEQEDVHVEDAMILYNIAIERPSALRKWKVSLKINRRFTSVRPHDKRGYRDQFSEEMIARLPEFHTLPDDLKEVVGNTDKTDYSRSFVMPFAMALTEPSLDNGPPEERRKRFTKLIGLYEHGYPSFYRRATVNWMQKNAKQLAGVEHIADVSKETRGEAWRMTQRQIRHLFYLSQ